LAKDCSQSAPIHLPMVGNHGLGERIVTPHDNVAALLPFDCESHLLQGADNIGSGNLR